MRPVALGLCFLLACSSEGTETPTDPPEIALELEGVASGLGSPVHLTAPVNDARLFIVSQTGQVRIFQNGQLLSTPFLDIAAKVLSGGERGLLSLAFDPAYATSGFFFVYYTDRSGDIVVERYRVSADASRADPASAK